MLEVSRINAVGLAITPVAVHLSALMRTAIEDHAALAVRVGIIVEMVSVDDSLVLGGDITVDTSVWGGAAFTLTLPSRAPRLMAISREKADA